MTEAIKDEMFNLNAKGPFFAVRKLAPLINQAFLGFDATFTSGAELQVDGGWSQLRRRQAICIEI